ncbi:MAG: diguanylate cyclase domain-containing protein [Thermodesulfobacteriota bacterium]
MTRRNILAYLAVFVLLEAVLFGLLTLAWRKDEGHYSERVLAHHRGEYASKHDSLGSLAQFVAREIFLRPEAVQLFADAATAAGPERDRLRRKLYALLLSSHENLEQQAFRQIHYHFPDGTSFLRMHRPERFGDPLFPYRPSVRLANTEKRFVTGFEVGRDFHAFRYVFPVQKAGVHLGSVEISVPFFKLKEALQSVYQEEYLLILKKNAVERAIRPHAETAYMGSDLAPGYLLEKADMPTEDSVRAGGLSSEMLAGINQRIRPGIVEALAAEKAFVRTARFGGNDYLVTFLPVIDVEGVNVGYILSYGKEPMLTSIRHGYRVAMALASVLLLLLFALHHWFASKVAAQRDFAKQLLEAIPTPICLKDRQGVFLACNRVFAELIRRPREEIIGQRNESLIEPAVASQQRQLDERVLASGESQQEEVHMAYPDGPGRDLMAVKAPFLGRDGQVVGVVGSFFDVGERKRMEEEIRRAHAELDQIFNTAANGMRVVDRDYTVVMANKTFCEMVGLSAPEVVGHKCYETFSGPACHSDQCSLARILKNPQRLESEVTKILPSGQRFECAITATPHYGPNGELLGIIEDFKDITQYKDLEQRLRDISITDDLTGLCNRRGFMTLAESQLECAVRIGYDLFLFYADLDNMKAINDALGHSNGDLALGATASILRESFRRSDILARLGGDEFAVLLTCRPGSACEQALVGRFEERVVRGNTSGELPFSISISYGLVQWQQGETLDQLLARADQRMYANKNQKKASRREEPPMPGG